MQSQLENRVYAGFFVRLAAFIIDSIIASLLVGIVKLPFSIASMGGASFLKSNFLFDYSFLDVLGYVGVAAYFILLTYFSHSTPGKMLLHLEVITKGGEWTFLNVLYRETIGRFLSSLLCIGYLAVLVTEKKQGFHDMLCDTYVVYAKMMPFPIMGRERVPVAANAVTGETEKEQALAESESGDMLDQPAGQKKAESLNPDSVTVPSYHTMSAFEMTESHPVSAGETSAAFDHVNPDSTNLKNVENKESQ